MNRSLPASVTAGVGTSATGAGDWLGGTAEAVGMDEVADTGSGSGQSAVGMRNRAAYSAGWTASSWRSRARYSSKATAATAVLTAMVLPPPGRFKEAGGGALR